MEELLNFILDIDFLTTKEFCVKYNIPTPLSKAKNANELAFEFITLDAIKYKLITEKAKELKKISIITKLRCENCKFILFKNCNNQESPFFNNPIPENKMCMFHST